jgi:hypothetical protein
MATNCREAVPRGRIRLSDIPLRGDGLKGSGALGLLTCGARGDQKAARGGRNVRVSGLLAREGKPWRGPGWCGGTPCAHTDPDLLDFGRPGICRQDRRSETRPAGRGGVRTQGSGPDGAGDLLASEEMNPTGSRVKWGHSGEGFGLLVRHEREGHFVGDRPELSGTDDLDLEPSPGIRPARLFQGVGQAADYLIAAVQGGDVLSPAVSPPRGTRPAVVEPPGACSRLNCSIPGALIRPGKS